MTTHSSDDEKPATIRDVFPDFTEEQLHEAEAKLMEYVEFTVRMYDRIRSDPELYAQFKLLTAERRRLRMEADGRSTSQ
jgi:hypothetical protein